MCCRVIPVEEVVVGVGGPELLEELGLGDVALLFVVEAGEEDLDLLVRKAHLKADQRLPQLLQRHCLAPILVDQVEALLNGHIVSAEELANFAEYSPLPFHRELLL